MGLLTWWKNFLRRLEEANKEQFGEGKGLDCCNLPGKRPLSTGSGHYAHSPYSTASNPHSESDPMKEV